MATTRIWVSDPRLSMTPFMSFVLSSLFNNAYSVVCTRQFGARCAYFPIIGAGDMSRKRRCLGPICHTDHSQVKMSHLLAFIDFDPCKTAGQSHDRRCHRKIMCASLIDNTWVVYVTKNQPESEIDRGDRMPKFSLLSSCDWRQQISPRCGCDQCDYPRRRPAAARLPAARCKRRSVRGTA